jgi:hypothetical protein
VIKEKPIAEMGNSIWWHCSGWAWT